MEQINKENWKEADLNVDSLWIINERDKSGKHANVYHGNFIPQIPNQLIRRYTVEGNTVMELFSGGGTTLFECESLKRNEQTLFIVELKDEHSSEKNFPQIYRYVKWIQQYYCPNTPCIIQPVLISLQPQRRRPKAKLSLIAQAKSSFNSTLPKNCNHIKLIEYSILDKDIIFTNLT